MDKPKVTIFLDVDGTLLPEDDDAQGDCSATIEREIFTPGRTRTVGGFTVTEPRKRFTVEENLTWRTNVAEFFRLNKDKIQVVWLTGWRENTKLLEPLFNIEPSPWLQWETDIRERNKKIALKNWLSNHPAPFIWIDDVAPVSFKTHRDLPNNRLIIVPNAGTAVTDIQLAEMQAFIDSQV